MSQPNILLIMPDQLRLDFLGAYGAKFLRTPTIDQLAKKGTTYTNAISPSPMCVPARSSLMTGMSAEANGILENQSWIRPDHEQMNITTWPKLLTDVGYKTVGIGKMHFYPWDINEGFETRVIAEDKRHISVQDDYHDFLANLGERKRHGNDLPGYDETKGAAINPLDEQHHVDRWVAKQACNYIQSLEEDAPFAMMVGFPGPHCPYDPPLSELQRINPDQVPAAIKPTDESLCHYQQIMDAYELPWANTDISNLNDDEIRTIRHHYAVLVERIDEDIKAILETLESKGKLENTVVIFCSDHGDYLGDYGLLGKAPFHQSSIKIPMIVRDFRQPQAKSELNHSLKSIADLFPTILDYAGVAHPNQPLNGQSLTVDSDERVILGVTVYGAMAMTSTYKLSHYLNGAKSLFNIACDPEERHNLIDISEHKPIQSQLELALVTGLINGLRASNHDKRVPESEPIVTTQFHKRDWQRRYPNAY
ncbi:sulfatase family protein [Vibrio sp. WXL210]|uniref:sulfatase family protein n=1 Tax=Vibrio sp. WXL210 TaxID=3450709 RepID=UPI003EC6D79D